MQSKSCSMLTSGVDAAQRHVWSRNAEERLQLFVPIPVTSASSFLDLAALGHYRFLACFWREVLETGNKLSGEVQIVLLHSQFKPHWLALVEPQLNWCWERCNGGETTWQDSYLKAHQHFDMLLRTRVTASRCGNTLSPRLFARALNTQTISHVSQAWPHRPSNAGISDAEINRLAASPRRPLTLADLVRCVSSSKVQPWPPLMYLQTW